MDPIPMPDVLDVNRDVALNDASDDDSARAQLDRARHALNRVCAYAQDLWRELDDVRRYLAEGVAGTDGSRSLLQSAAEWESWARTFADVSSTLAGPAGDSGAGESAARLHAQENGVELPPLRR